MLTTSAGTDAAAALRWKSSQPPRQATWFGISDAPPMPAGPLRASSSTGRSIRSFRYHVPSRLERIIQPGQRLRVPLGQGNKLTVGYCVRVDAVAAG